jgi:hypothetical protein
MYGMARFGSEAVIIAKLPVHTPKAMIRVSSQTELKQAKRPTKSRHMQTRSQTLESALAAQWP